LYVTWSRPSGRLTVESDSTPLGVPTAESSGRHSAWHDDVVQMNFPSRSALRL
jgi:hypothetical protein